MAVTFNSWAIDQPGVATSSVTVPSLTNGGIYVQVDGTGTGAPATAMTFGGISGTLIDTGTTNGTSPSVNFIFVGVPSGSQSRVVTAPGGTFAGITFSTWYLNGVDQTTPLHAHHYSASGQTNSITTTNSCWIIGSSRDGSPSASTPLTTNRSIQFQAVDANAMVAAASPFTNTWTGSSGFTFVTALNQVLVATSTPLLASMGVGS